MANSIFSWFRDSGVVSASPSAVLTVSTTSAQTGADTNPTDLWTYSLPANTLGADGRGLRVTAWGATGATANAKTISLLIGGNTVATLSGTTANDQTWMLELRAIRTAASTVIVANAVERAGATFSSGNRSLSLSLDTTTAITIKVTGTNGVAAAGDVVFKAATVELLN